MKKNTRRESGRINIPMTSEPRNISLVMHSVLESASSGSLSSGQFDKLAGIVNSIRIAMHDSGHIDHASRNVIAGGMRAMQDIADRAGASSKMSLRPHEVAALSAMVAACERILPLIPFNSLAMAANLVNSIAKSRNDQNN